MVKIYSPPVDIKEPDLALCREPDGWNLYEQACEDYLEQVQAYAKREGSGTEAGEVISFPVGDGSAQYVVLSLKPLALLHLRIGDAYQFPYAHLLTPAAVREEVRRAKAVKKIFAK